MYIGTFIVKWKSRKNHVVAVCSTDSRKDSRSEKWNQCGIRLFNGQQRGHKILWKSMENIVYKKLDQFLNVDNSMFQKEVLSGVCSLAIDL